MSSKIGRNFLDISLYGMECRIGLEYYKISFEMCRELLPSEMVAAPFHELFTLFTASTLSLHALLPMIIHCLKYTVSYLSSYIAITSYGMGGRVRKTWVAEYHW